VRPLAAKFIAFFRGLMRPRHGAELDEESEIWDDRERDEFGCLVDSSADLFGDSHTSPGLASTAGAAEHCHVDEPGSTGHDYLSAFYFNDDDDESLRLYSVESLSPQEAEAIDCPGFSLFLSRLADLSPETAKALSHHEILGLDGLTTLSDETAEALAGYQGTCLFLRGLTTLSAKAAAALRANPRIVLPERFTETPK
jgi:hypothetical protein